VHGDWRWASLVLTFFLFILLLSNFLTQNSHITFSPITLFVSPVELYLKTCKVWELEALKEIRCYLPCLFFINILSQHHVLTSQSHRILTLIELCSSSLVESETDLCLFFNSYLRLCACCVLSTIDDHLSDMNSREEPFASPFFFPTGLTVASNKRC
jgi:hypothetical protein